MQQDVIFSCSAILFDSDGVLVDSQAGIDRLLRDWAVEHGLDADEVIKQSRGRRDVELIRLVAPFLDVQAEANRIEQRELLDVDDIRAIPGARELLASLPERFWAVVTSGSAELVCRRLAAAKLPLPRTLISADDVTEGKPSPQGYLAAAERLGVDPGDCVVLEDTPSGVAAGQAAGARVVGVLTTAAPQDLPADLHVRTLCDVTVTSNQGRLVIGPPPGRWTPGLCGRGRW